MRITGGMYRSRKLVAPAGFTTRPTSDRVREALFSVLTSAHSLEGISVLDLYAGTGALALEALSRGAACATLVERSRPALDALYANIAALGVGARAQVLAAPVARGLRALAEGPAFDLVLVDPPYADVSSGAVTLLLAAAVHDGVLAPGGQLVLEHASGDESPTIEGLECVEVRPYGDTALSFYAVAR